MKRFLLPASALVLVVTACGAGAKPAPRVTQVSARVPSVHTLVVRRRRAALRQARSLVRELALPPGARRDRARRDHGGILHQSGPTPLGEVVDARRFWRVREPLATVAAFLKAHAPRSFMLADSYHSTRQHYLTRSFTWPGGRHRIAARLINETFAALRGGTVIRVDAKVIWLYPRSPREKVPAATREIVVHAPGVSRTVTSPTEVARIVRWFDALPISPPGIGFLCPALVTRTITLSFRSASRARLAHATVPGRAAGVCDPIEFTIGGKARKPLVDSPYGKSFAERLQHLLGFRIATPKG